MRVMHEMAQLQGVNILRFEHAAGRDMWHGLSMALRVLGVPYFAAVCCGLSSAILFGLDIQVQYVVSGNRGSPTYPVFIDSVLHISLGVCSYI